MANSVTPSPSPHRVCATWRCLVKGHRPCGAVWLLGLSSGDRVKGLPISQSLSSPPGPGTYAEWGRRAAATGASVIELTAEQTLALIEETQRAVDLSHFGLQALSSLDSAKNE